MIRFRWLLLRLGTFPYIILVVAYRSYCGGTLYKGVIVMYYCLAVVVGLMNLFVCCSIFEEISNFGGELRWRKRYLVFSKVEMKLVAKLLLKHESGRLIQSDFWTQPTDALDETITEKERMLILKFVVNKISMFYRLNNEVFRTELILIGRLLSWRMTTKDMNENKDTHTHCRICSDPFKQDSLVTVVNPTEQSSHTSCWVKEKIGDGKEVTSILNYIKKNFIDKGNEELPRLLKESE